MKLRKTTALVTALSFIAAVTLTACGHDPLMDDEIEKPEPVTTWEHTTEEYTEETTEEPTTEPVTEPSKTKLGNGGDEFTVLAWNHYDAPILVANWLGMDTKDVRYAEDLKTPDGVSVKFICLDTTGYDAYDRYDSLFNKGEDIDVYLCEPDWALKLLNDDSRSAPIEDLGISEAEIFDMYPYTLEQCKNSNGVLKALAYDASPGCFAYNAELAKEYLGAETPEEMQSLVGDWEKFTETAANVADKSNGKVALADSLGGMWQAYSSSGFSKPLVIDNKPVIGDEVKDFADMAKKLWDCGGVPKNGQWTDDWYMAGRIGNCMGYFVPAWGFENGGFAIEATSNDTLGKWALCEGPQAYWWGGTLLAVNPATDNGDEAYDFLYASAVDVGGLMDLAEMSSYLPNSELVTEFLIDEEFVFSDQITKNFTNGKDYLSILDRNAKAVDLTGKITPYDADIRAVIYSAVEYKFLKEGKSWEDTVEYMQDDIAASLPELD